MFPRGEKNEAYQEVFTGISYLAPLVDESLPVSVSHVTFEPKTRNHWHIHDGGYQILLVTEGEGWYQEEGQPARHLKAGDVVVTHDGVKHWHGATRSSWFSHIAITAGTPLWLEAVSDEQYEVTE
ncbi:cupin domain-containing protein [Exiguobacterium sp. LL15]|uniref:cupin domain-containing protein n=1 Tax=Exiguobacterium sp. LL15 TaxID=2950547 RepID=UPI00210A69CA|nr:cupin domain-containing protein [Exiguobacterium sp. LL15]MCQ4090692.1 cupin domain-containing protein [Exiguobacterium sp. LL15]